MVLSGPLPSFVGSCSRGESPNLVLGLSVAFDGKSTL
ncbi:MAG: hypothetical protein QOJ17_264, partial [Rhodospirillaceae bacterium]|nr:hypothetical protein [Rhodospirillaceae bacterium]